MSKMTKWERLNDKLVPMFLPYKLNMREIKTEKDNDKALLYLYLLHTLEILDHMHPQCTGDCNLIKFMSILTVFVEGNMLIIEDKLHMEKEIVHIMGITMEILDRDNPTIKVLNRLLEEMKL